MPALDKIRTTVNGKTIDKEAYKNMSTAEQIAAMGATFRNMTAGERVRAAEELLGEYGAAHVAREWSERHIWANVTSLVTAAGADADVNEDLLDVQRAANAPTEEEAKEEAEYFGWVRLDWSKAPGRAKRVPSRNIGWVRLAQDTAHCATGVVLDALPTVVYGRDIETFEELAAALGGKGDDWGVDALLTAGWYRVEDGLDDDAVWVKVDDTSDFPSVDDWSCMGSARELCEEEGIEPTTENATEIASYHAISERAEMRLKSVTEDPALPDAVVGEIADVTIWGRTSGGQYVWLDGEIRAAALYDWTHTEEAFEMVLAERGE